MPETRRHGDHRIRMEGKIARIGLQRACPRRIEHNLPHGMIVHGKDARILPRDGNQYIHARPSSFPALSYYNRFPEPAQRKSA